MAVSRFDILAAYRLMLGREPSDAEIDTWAAIPSLEALRQTFIDSYEFQALLERLHPATGERRLPLALPPLSIAWETDGPSEQALLEYVEATWTALGNVEPHWSVLGSAHFKASEIAANRAEFYGSGAYDLGIIESVLARHGLRAEAFHRVVEYGCGVGRVTLHLARVFRDVLALDISVSHIGLAREAALESGVTNVQFRLVTGTDFGMDGPFDLWFSRIVLQHNPPPIIARILRRMFSLLAPEGLAIFQLPSYAPGYGFDVAGYLGKPNSHEIEVHCLPQAVVFALAREAGCVCLDVREDLDMEFPWLSHTYVFQRS
jgi:SAM-dependent methyltransferase